MASFAGSTLLLGGFTFTSKHDAPCSTRSMRSVVLFPSSALLPTQMLPKWRQMKSLSDILQRTCWNLCAGMREEDLDRQARENYFQEHDKYPPAGLDALERLRGQERRGIGQAAAGEPDPRAGQVPGQGIARINRLPQLQWQPLVDALYTAKTGNLGGMEHDVWRDGPTAVKMTRTVIDGPIVENYLERLVFGNEHLGDDSRVVGWAAESPDHKEKLVVIQPWVPGRRATQQEIDDHMASLGYDTAMGGVYHRDQGDLWVTDLLPKNVIKGDDGKVRIIDFLLPLNLSESKKERFLGMIEGQKRDALPTRQ